MNSLKTTGIIIRRANTGEADRILTIFTKEYGKLSVLAKGVRKISSKLAGNLEPYSVAEFIFQEGKSLETVISAVTIDHSYTLSDDCKNFAKAHYFGELIDKLVPENEKHSEIFEIFKAAIIRLKRGDNDFLLPYFELKMLDKLGYSPQVYYCVKCRHKLLADKNYFSFSDGGVACEECRSAGFLEISVEAIKILRLIIESDVSLIDRLNIDLKLREEIENITDNYIKYILDRNLRSKQIMNKL